MSKSTFCSGFTTFIFAATVAFAADTPKSDSPKKHDSPARISSNVAVNAASNLSAKEANELSFAAGRILKHVAQARHSLADKKKDDAARHVEQGVKLIAIIDHVLPHSKVKTEIKSGDLVYSDEDDVAPRYLVIFDELERRDIISPIVQAKKEAEPAPLPDQAKSATPKDTPTQVAVSYADLVYSSARLDIELARRALNHAKRSLEADKLEQADKALLALQSQGVLFEYDEVELPLAEVADNLKLAETELKEGRHDDAKAALHVAMDELKRYEKMVGDKRGAEVKSLHQEIDKLAVELGKGNVSEADRQKVAAKISEWWQTATKWMKNKSK